MEKLKDVKEALSYIRQGEIITSNGKDQILFKNDKVYCYNDGSHYNLDTESFLDLYKNTNLFLYEEQVEIDDKKDEEYYRYYKK